MCIVCSFWQVYYGSSIKLKLEEGFVFGATHTFQANVAKVAAPTNPCTNHRILNDRNVECIFDLLNSGNAVRVQLSPMILRPKLYMGAGGMEVKFLAKISKARFQALLNAHVVGGGGMKERTEVFLNGFTWKLVDGQLI
jgi:hypothetical protein